MNLKMYFQRVNIKNIKVTSVEDDPNCGKLVCFTADVVPEDNCPCEVKVDDFGDVDTIDIVSGKIEGVYPACDIPEFSNINEYASYIEKEGAVSFIAEEDLDSIDRTVTFSDDWGFDPLDEWGLIDVTKAVITLSKKSVKEINALFEDEDSFEESISSKRNTRMFLKKKLHESSKKGNRLREDYGWEIKSGSEWDAFDYLAEVLGYEELAVSLAKAMGTNELSDLLAYICRNYDIEGDFIEGYEEEEDF